MGSSALAGMLAGIEEVRDLRRANPTPPGGLPAEPRVVRAINRSSVVLLCSHLERYLRAVNEEAVGKINQVNLPGAALTVRLRLQHSRVPVDDIVETQWHRRETQLRQFSLSDSWLWSNSPKGELDHERLLRWMKSPSPQRIQRLFQLWGAEDVFGTITRTAHTRQAMWLKLTELVDKRNNIAHGDFTTEATSQDVASYLEVVRKFCERADRVLANRLSRTLGIPAPW